jgi:hypothetical protein
LPASWRRHSTPTNILELPAGWRTHSTPLQLPGLQARKRRDAEKDVQGNTRNWLEGCSLQK